MPAITNPALFVQSEPVMSGLDERMRVFLLTSALSLSAPIGHVMPHLAAIVRAVRLASNVSQMEMGTNRHKKDNRPIWTGVSVPSDLSPIEKNYRKAGYFSLIANIEQGGRKTPIPADFVVFLATVSGLAEYVINDAIAEDAALSTASAANNPVQPETTVTVDSAVKSQSAPKKPVPPKK